MSEKPQKNKSTLQGKVISSKMDKTIVVLIERKVKHPVYKENTLNARLKFMLMI